QGIRSGSCGWITSFLGSKFIGNANNLVGHYANSGEIIEQSVISNNEELAPVSAEIKASLWDLWIFGRKRLVSFARSIFFCYYRLADNRGQLAQLVRARH
ncbi:MAG TPA: hypothetical protein PLT32_02430, partial [bacterium]|nr:hypothetical protein [bacterium]